MKLRKEETTAHSQEVTQREHRRARTHRWWGNTAKGFFLAPPTFYAVVIIMKPGAQGAKVGLLGAYLPPAYLTNTRTAPTGHDQNMSSLRLVPLGGQAGRTWNHVSPSPGNVLRP